MSHTAHPLRKIVFSSLKYFAAGIFAVAILPLHAAENKPNVQCFIVKNLSKNKIVQKSGTCDERVPPASTFKIPLSLIGFDSGILESSTQPQWAFQKKYESVVTSCNADQTPATWMKNSCVWYSQELTQKLGAEKFKSYVVKFDYGNQNISGNPGQNNGLTRSWLGGSSLRISPEEQIVFLSQLVQHKLPVSPEAHTLTEQLVHDGVLVDKWHIYGKTGTAFQENPDGSLNSKRQLGWYVGWLTKDKETLIFAYLIKDKTDQADYAGPRAKAAAREELVAFVGNSSAWNCSDI